MTDPHYTGTKKKPKDPAKEKGSVLEKCRNKVVGGSRGINRRDKFPNFPKGRSVEESHGQSCVSTQSPGIKDSTIVECPDVMWRKHQKCRAWKCDNCGAVYCEEESICESCLGADA